MVGAQVDEIAIHTGSVSPAAGNTTLLSVQSSGRRRYDRPEDPVPQIGDKEILLADDPYYDKESDTYRVIHKGHASASAVTNSEGVTVFFDPENHDVLGFSITQFSTYYEAHVTPAGEFEVVLPARIPANLEEEMDFDEETIRKGVRIAEFY